MSAQGTAIDLGLGDLEACLDWKVTGIGILTLQSLSLQTSVI